MAAKTCIPGFVKSFGLFFTSSTSLINSYGIRSLSVVAVKSSTSQFGGVGVHSFPGYCHVLNHSSSPLHHYYRCKGTHMADSSTSWSMGVAGIEVLDDFVPLTEPQLQTGVAEQINQSIELGETGRLFAVVHIRGIQHKVTAGDIIAVKYDFPPTVGDRLRIEKVLAVGGKDFSLIGQPLLGRDVVRVDATVVEKTLSHNRIWFVYQKRKNWKRFRLLREHFTMLVINSIQVGKLPVEVQHVIEEKTG